VSKLPETYTKGDALLDYTDVAKVGVNGKLQVQVRVDIRIYVRKVTNCGK